MKFPDFSLNGRVALVTGGSKGLGRAMALTFAHAGADVAISSRHLDECEEVAVEIRAMGRRSLAIRTDIGQKSEIDSMVHDVVEKLGTLDILVNNAATDLRKRLVETTPEDFDNMMAINLRGTFLCCQAAARVMMPRRKGVIINITSGAARRNLPRTGAYCVSKAAVAMMTECLADDLIAYGIRINSIGPGPVRTDMNRIHWENPQTRAEHEAKLFMKRYAEPEEIAGIALLLASDASSYVTGQAVYFSNR